MGEQTEDLYRNFSRKDLQNLCKKYGLPANKSNSEMATSLILYLEKKNLNSSTIWEATRSNHFASPTPELLAGARRNLTDCRGKMSQNGSGNNHFSSRDVRRFDLQNCKGPRTSYKASEDVGNSTQVHRDCNSGAGLLENAFSCVISPPVGAPPPNLQFDVSSDDGIQIYVDLNSSPSDWIESLKGGIHIKHDTQELKSSSFHHKLGQLSSSKQMKGSSITDLYEETGNGDVEDRSYPNTTDTGAHVQVEPDEAEGSLSSPGPCRDAAHNLEKSGEEYVTVSSKIESDKEKRISGPKELVLSGPAVSVITEFRTSDYFSANSLLSDPKCSKMLENQSLSMNNDIYGNLSLQQINGRLEPFLQFRRLPASASVGQDSVDTCLGLAGQSQRTGAEHCGLTNSVLVDSHSPDPNDQKLNKVKTKHGEASIFGKSSRQITEEPNHLSNNKRTSTTLSPYQRHESLGAVNLTVSNDTENIVCSHGAGQEAVEMQSSVVGIHIDNASLSPSRNGGSEHMVVPKQNGFAYITPANTTEHNEDIPKSQETASMEDVGRSNAWCSREGSACLDFRDSKEDSDLEFNREKKRKRRINNVEVQSQSAKPNTKVLQSSKLSSRDVRARRRSSRLYTK